MYVTVIFLLPVLCQVALAAEGEDPPKPQIVEVGPIGQTFNVPSMDMLSTTLAADGVKISKRFNPNCFVDQVMKTSIRDKAFHSSTRAVYSALRTETNIDVSLAGTYTMKASLDAVTNSKSASTEEVQGYVLKIYDYSMKKSISQQCLNKILFTTDFLDDFNKLPLKITNPHEGRSWSHYVNFNNKYGTHMVKAIVYGSMIYQYSFAKSTMNYKQKDFMIKACVGLQGQTSVGEVKVDACLGVTKEDREKSTSLEMNDKTVVRGGTRKTRAMLLHRRDEKLVVKFLNEGKTTASPVEYKFTSIFKLLKNRYDIGTPEYTRAKNLEEYIKGYLVYGCELKKINGKVVQKFELAPQSNPDNPTYQCMVMQPGCNTDDDCHYRVVPAECSCNGASCIENKYTEFADGRNKLTPYAYNDGERGTGHGCSYQYVPAECHCDYKPGFTAAWQNQSSKRDEIADDDDQENQEGQESQDYQGSEEDHGSHDDQDDFQSKS